MYMRGGFETACRQVEGRVVSPSLVLHKMVVLQHSSLLTMVSLRAQEVEALAVGAQHSVPFSPRNVYWSGLWSWGP